MKNLAVLGFILAACAVQAEEATVAVNAIDAKGLGAALGAIRAEDSPEGLRLMPDLAGLPPGPHGFHVHELPDCGAKDKDGKPVAGLAAGNHYDPGSTGKHAGPWGDGHLGDLPALLVDPDGKATLAVTAGRLKVADLRGRSLMIHAENDNYADQPGGARIACGVVN